MLRPALDRLGRPLGVLRLSVTARCNLSCPYCCPDGDDPPDLLTLTERSLLVRTATALGVHTLRLTGGEPLLHQQLEELIQAVRPLHGLDRIALTTNGTLLTGERARRLREAGLDRITVSLDGSDGASVASMAGLEQGPSAGESVLARVLEALENARMAGFDPGDGALKLNAVIIRGLNDSQLLPLAELARAHQIELRLIEFMDVGNRNGWSAQRVMSAAEMVERIGRRWPLVCQGRSPNATAQRWSYRDGGGVLGTVASISAPFCGDCNRLRITADGKAYTCLFASGGTDLRPWLRPGVDGEGLRQAMGSLWQQRQDRYSEDRHRQQASTSPADDGPQVGTRAAEMAYLGG